MRITFPRFLTSGGATRDPIHQTWDKVRQGLPLGAIVALAAALRFANLQALGEVNHYYTAAITSMLGSWYNFFFLAAEPGGSVTVDKTPVGLWLQAISAYFLGVNGFSVLLPQLIAGLLSIVVVYHLVRRSFGKIAGLVAALALAITPVAVATDRNNTIDSTLILALLLAGWTFIKATETRKLRFLLLGATLVGIGFNIKMLEAFLPLPAFYALYLLGAAESFWRKLGKLALASILLLVVSLFWVTVVDLTPAGQRPYIGSSGDNSEFSLITGYNGIDRLVGMFGRRSGGGAGRNSGAGRPAGGGRTAGGNAFGGGAGGNNRSLPGITPGQNNGFTPGGSGGNNRGFRQPGGGGNGFAQIAGAMGISETGQAGPLRLILPPLSKEASWLLPLALTGLLLLIFATRPAWPLAAEHRAAILWGGWLITGGVFFSVAGFFHEYYLSIIAPPLAALVGISLAEISAIARQRAWPATLILAAAVALTLWLQAQTVMAFIHTIPWLPLVMELLLLGLVGVMAAFILHLRPLPTQPAPRWLIPAAWACWVVALLVTPAIWSYLTMLYPSENQSLPAAFTGNTNGPPKRGGLQINQALVDYLQANTNQDEYLMAVPSSMQGSDYVLATGRPVLYLGGFMGVDQVKTTDELAQMVQDGKLRFIYWNAGGGFGSGSSAGISGWVGSNCKLVPGFETITRNAGAPDGTSAGQATGAFRGFGGMQVALYDCGQ